MTNHAALVSQKATRSLPNSTQPEELVLWDYAFTFLTDEDTAFEVTWNEARTVIYDEPPNVRIDDYGRTIVFERLDLGGVQCARASVQGATFPAPIAPTLEVVEPVTIGSTGTASIAAHLASFLTALLGRSQVAAWPMEIRCFYVSVLNGLSMPVPVVLVRRQDVGLHDAELFEQIESSIRQWLAAAQPPTNEARLSFDMTVWSTIEGIDVPLLHIADASLPMSAVEMT